MFSKIKPFFTKLNPKNIFFIPAIIGSHVGAVYTGYIFFKKSKDEDLITNVSFTIAGVCWGICGGSILGLLWPVTTLVFTGRFLDKRFPDKKYPTQED
jgi:hypothetical protein